MQHEVELVFLVGCERGRCGGLFALVAVLTLAVLAIFVTVGIVAKVEDGNDEIGSGVKAGCNKTTPHKRRGSSGADVNNLDRHMCI
jgi:hypothetical protein